MSDSENTYENFLVHFNAAIEKSSRNKSEINLVAVSKTQPIEKIKSVYQMGHRHFGENYVQEALDKQKQLVDFNIFWHFIGSLQKNKVKLVVGAFDLIHSVDSLELAKKISECAVIKKIEQKCLLQINIGEETTKGGFSIENSLKQLKELLSLPNIKWQGVMSMPPIISEEKAARTFLKATKNIFEEIKLNLDEVRRKEWTQISMGTSHDFIWAIEEGSNMIRIGTLIFGERIKKN
jgi:pyridoxal phosphate enzyme (YggS family)